MTEISFGQERMHLYRTLPVETGMEQLLSVTDAAKRLGGISRWTIHAWLSKGKLQRTKVGGRTMIRESELQKVIEDGGKSAAPRQREM